MMRNTVVFMPSFVMCVSALVQGVEQPDSRSLWPLRSECQSRASSIAALSEESGTETAK